MQEKLENRLAVLIAELDGADDDTIRCELRSYGGEAVAALFAAYNREPSGRRRALLVRALWESRDASAIPALTAALRDDDETAWKEALDGLVTVGGPMAVTALERSRLEIAALSDGVIRLEWIHESLEQLRNGEAD